MQQIVHLVPIAASCERVFWALTTEEGLAGWWTERVAIQQPFGGVVNFQFLPDFNPSMELVQATQDERLEWKCIGGHAAWRDHSFVFELRPSETDPNQMQLLFRQTYTFDLDEELHGMYNHNWGHYLTSLRMFSETGTGQPYRGTA